VTIQRKNYQDTLRMRFNLGPDPEDPGKDILRARSYTRGRHTKPDQHYYSMAKAFAKLYDADLVNTYRVMHVELIED